MSLLGTLLAVLLILIYIGLCMFIGFSWWKWMQFTKVRGKYKKVYTVYFLFSSIDLFRSDNILAFSAMDWRILDGGFCL